MRKFIAVDEAINLLPDGDYIHTFSNLPFGLLGVDCSREDVIDKFKTSDKIELTGEQARGLGHGLAAYNNDIKKQSEILFVETDIKKLLSFDPDEEVENAD